MKTDHIYWGFAKPAREEVHFNGTYYDDIDWGLKIHSLGTNCPICGADGAEGHCSACPYTWSEMESPRGRGFLKDMIKDAIDREVKGGIRK